MFLRGDFLQIRILAAQNEWGSAKQGIAICNMAVLSMSAVVVVGWKMPKVVS